VDDPSSLAHAILATILMSLTDQPRGLRSYSAIDLEGNQWEFSQMCRLVEPDA
jgi:uncharacterized glyoxalase superfamily protein PhnB